MSRVRVLVLAADPLARRGLSALLSSEDEIAVAGSADPDEELPLTDGLPADVVCWDLGHAGRGGPEDLRDLATGEAPVVVLVEREPAPGRWLAAGARGVLFRGGDGRTLAIALSAAASGLVVLDPEFARAAAPGSSGGADLASEALTPRELEVLSLLTLGLSNREIARRLSVSEHTAKFHVNSILGKLGAGTRAEAIVRAARLGLVML